MGRRSLSRAGLLDGTSSIFSTTTIVRVAHSLRLEEQKKVYTSSDVLFFTEKEQKKVYKSSDVLFSTENVGEAVA